MRFSCFFNLQSNSISNIDMRNATTIYFNFVLALHNIFVNQFWFFINFVNIESRLEYKV